MRFRIPHVRFLCASIGCGGDEFGNCGQVGCGDGGGFGGGGPAGGGPDGAARGTDERTAKHFLQRVLNSLAGKCEVSDTQIAAELLQLDSELCSTNFVNVWVGGRSLAA